MGLEINADKNMYIAIIRDQNAGRFHNIIIDNSPLKVLKCSDISGKI